MSVSSANPGGTGGSAGAAGSVGSARSAGAVGPGAAAGAGQRRFVVEADGGSRGNPGPAGYGAVVLDAETGETLAETAEYLGLATNNVAEYRGLVAGLRAAYELDPRAEVRVRMDSKLAVEQMCGRWKIKHPGMRSLAAEARSIFPPDSVSYEWIPREQNKRADQLANEAMDAGKHGEQWEPAPRATRAPERTPEPTSYRTPEPTSDRIPEPTSGETRGASAEPTVRPEAGPEAIGPRAARTDAEGPFPGENDATGPLAAAAATEAPAATAAKAEAESAAPRAEPLEGPSTPQVGWGAPADLGRPTTFVLLRHGETSLTPQKRFSGSGGSDPGLSDVGYRQAEAVAAALAARGTIQAVVSSPLRRCRETAGTVAARLGLEMRIDEGLRETDFGAWEGLTFAEVRERYPQDLEAWLASADAAPTGGGESFATVARRVALTRDKLLTRYHGRTVLLVTHVTPVKTLVRLALGAPPQSLFRMELSASSVSAVAYYSDGTASLRLLNDTGHLR